MTSLSFYINDLFSEDIHTLEKSLKDVRLLFQDADWRIKVRMIDEMNSFQVFSRLFDILQFGQYSFQSKYEILSIITNLAIKEHANISRDIFLAYNIADVLLELSTLPNLELATKSLECMNISFKFLRDTTFESYNTLSFSNSEFDKKIIGLIKKGINHTDYVGLCIKILSSSHIFNDPDIPPHFETILPVLIGCMDTISDFNIAVDILFILERVVLTANNKLCKFLSTLDISNRFIKFLTPNLSTGIIEKVLYSLYYINKQIASKYKSHSIVDESLLECTKPLITHSNENIRRIAILVIANAPFHLAVKSNILRLVLNHCRHLIIQDNDDIFSMFSITMEKNEYIDYMVEIGIIELLLEILESVGSDVNDNLVNTITSYLNSGHLVVVDLIIASRFYTIITEHGTITKFTSQIQDSNILSRLKNIDTKRKSDNNDCNNKKRQRL
ncbi:hypothetical protein PPL_03864 [Heterostelium album PN500]|uniref:Uncharacterized protein n=1 Tax=Heterostelium pallidum (strain ATCC 26659 / Pp 5 / PN500) TaxID=670386 RepID=D3B5C8_HETP5|nr:hypothetical protein PPL_03864 [Heterostelium album PN500]EFA83076.1 hypothetical protein PPL_03864 [Heterostelium album PN500]|eukprot:XP_020435193.1 hypothetical protein PPL_03864 [Heterostelium album PN500]